MSKPNKIAVLIITALGFTAVIGASIVSIPGITIGIAVAFLGVLFLLILSSKSIVETIGEPDTVPQAEYDQLAHDCKTAQQNLDATLGYINHVPAKIAVLDTQGRFIHLNDHCNQYQLGQTIYELDNTYENKEITTHFEFVLRAGRPAEGTNAQGDKLHFTPIFGSKNQVTAIIFTAFDISEVLDKAKKIKAYQDFEVVGITRYLKEGLSQGVLNFTYTPEPFDDDTAEAASQYNQIWEALADSVAIIKSYMQEINSMLADIATGNLTSNITREYVGDFDSIKRSLNSITKRLNETVVDISFVAERVSNESAQLSQSSVSLSKGVSDQMLSLQEVAEGISLVDTRAKGNSDFAQKAAELAVVSKSNAEAGHVNMRNLLGAMESITESSGKISQIVKTIEGIAFQTNLLALNAAVEAAHAGDHGRGFRVVAEEVRSLATRSMDAAKQTTILIRESMESVQNGTTAASVAATSIDEIVQNIADISSVINNISDSSVKQTTAVSTINDDLFQISHVAQASSITSEETTTAAEGLDDQVAILKSKLSFFATDVSALFTKKTLDASTSSRINLESLRHTLGERKEYGPGDVILKEGDTQADTMYFVLEGNADIIKGYRTLSERRLNTLNPGDLFGEVAVFLREPRTAMVIANNDVVLLEIHRNIFPTLMEKNPETAYGIIETLCKRLKSLIN